MNFQQPVFFLFFLIILVCYFSIHPSKRWVVLLVGSLIFYASLGIYSLFIPLFLVILTGYFFGGRIGQAPEAKKRELFLIGVSIQILMLAFYRLYPVVVGQLIQTGSLPPGKIPETLAAIGVSFYVFQAIAYLADIYLDRIKPETHFGRFALFICFFPRLIQGPIERGKDLLPQLLITSGFDLHMARQGALRFMMGLFKKVVIADRLALIVDPIYGDVHAYYGVFLWGATVAYAFQLYFDFSGYTDMALGMAQIFNIRLSENFKSPYLADSITEFWRRWHITFSRWIMDYLFQPLQLAFRKIGKIGVVSALILTFLLSGLWHGISGGYVIWGLLHGTFLSIALLTAPYQRKFEKKYKIERYAWIKGIKIVFTFGLVCLAWIFFRAASLQDAFAVLVRGLPWNWLSPGEMLNFKIGVKALLAGNKMPVQAVDFWNSLFQQWTSISAGLVGINGGIFLLSLVLMGIFCFKWNPQEILANAWYWRWGFYFGFVCLVLFSVIIKPVPVQDTIPYLYLNY